MVSIASKFASLLVLPILGLLTVIVSVFLLVLVIVPVVRVGAQETSSIDEVCNDTDEDNGAQKGEGGGGAGGVEVEEPGLILQCLNFTVKFFGVSSGEAEQEAN